MPALPLILFIGVFVALTATGGGNQSQSASEIAAAEGRSTQAKYACAHNLYTQATESLVLRRTEKLVTQDELRTIRSMQARSVHLDKELEHLPRRGKQINRTLLAEYQIEQDRIESALSLYGALVDLIRRRERHLASGALDAETLDSLGHQIRESASQLSERLAFLEQSADSAYELLAGVEVLNKLLEDSNDTAIDLASLVGISQSTLRDIRLGRSRIWSSSLGRDIAKALGTDAEAFLAAWMLPARDGLSEELDSKMRKKDLTNAALARALGCRPGLIETLRSSFTDESRHVDMYQQALAHLNAPPPAPLTAEAPEPPAAEPQAPEDELLLASAHLSLFVDNNTDASPDALAVALHWRPERMNHLIEGTSWIRLHEIHQLCEHLGVDPAPLLTAYGYPADTFTSLDGYVVASVLETRRHPP